MILQLFHHYLKTLTPLSLLFGYFESLGDGHRKKIYKVWYI